MMNTENVNLEALEIENARIMDIEVGSFEPDEYSTEQSYLNSVHDEILQNSDVE